MNPLRVYLTSWMVAVCLMSTMAQPVKTKRDPMGKTPRSAGFFGLHLDFHAVDTTSQVGLTLTEGMVDTLLDRVRPDYVQIDYKGHPGISSYPTKVGNPARSFTQDPLATGYRPTPHYPDDALFRRLGCSGC